MIKLWKNLLINRWITCEKAANKLVENDKTGQVDNFWPWKTHKKNKTTQDFGGFHNWNSGKNQLIRIVKNSIFSTLST